MMRNQKLMAWPARAGIVLLLGLVMGLSVVVAGVIRQAHAAPHATLTVSDCTGESGPNQIATVINSASAGDTVNFSCSGTIPITSTLSISKDLSLDGSGEMVTLDGQGTTRVFSVSSGVTFTLKALTIADGSARTFGGGLYNSAGGTVSISNSTFANNSANGNIGGGISNGGTVSISGSIVAGNTGGDCLNNGTITDSGYNLSSDSSCGFTGTTDLQNVNPQLGPLASNGGPTQTMALLTGSPAIDAGPARGNCPTTDQRGFTRPDDSETTCDIGAYESGAMPADSDLALTKVPSDITVNATSPQGAVVTYTLPTVVDEDSSLPTVRCVPASGSLFPIGDTTVKCTVTDVDDSNSPVSKSFLVHVKGAAEQLQYLITLVKSFHNPRLHLLVFRLQHVLAEAGYTDFACQDLALLQQLVEGSTPTQAAQVLSAIARIQAVLGCSTGSEEQSRPCLARGPFGVLLGECSLGSGGSGGTDREPRTRASH